MPSVSEFFGITIYFYFNDHPPPHFHAKYAEHEARFRINTLEMYEGELPRRVRSLVIEWASMHRKELLENWYLARDGEDLKNIEPLD
jgi:hypothetical protein